MKSILTLFALFFCLQIFSQIPEFCPKGAVFYEERSGFFGGSPLLLQYNYEKDTIVLGQSCKKLLGKSAFSSGQTFIYQMHDSIFGLQMNEWKLLFRTQFLVGEFLKLSRNNDTLLLRVDSLKAQITPFISKIYFLSLKNQLNPWPPFIFYEKFGPANGLWAKNTIVVPDIDSKLLCYEDDVQPLVHFTTQNCISTTSDPTTFAPIKLFPNPVFEKLNIEFAENSDVNVQIFDNLGHFLKEIDAKSDFSIDVEAFVSGVYFLKILDKKTGAVTMRRFLKI
jgi:hypothetical protein